MRLVSMLAFAALLLAGCGAGSKAVTSSSPVPVPVHIRDFQFQPRDLSVRRGQILEVSNDGDIAHNLTIERGPDGRKPTTTLAGTGSFLPGRRVRLKVDLPAGDTYAIVCSVPGHRDLGLYGKLRVR